MTGMPGVTAERVCDIPTHPPTEQERNAALEEQVKALTALLEAAKKEIAVVKSIAPDALARE